MTPPTGEWHTIRTRAETIKAVLLLVILVLTGVVFIFRDQARVQSAVQAADYTADWRAQDDTNRAFRAEMNENRALIDTISARVQVIVQAGQRQQLRVLCSSQHSTLDICRGADR